MAEWLQRRPQGMTEVQFPVYFTFFLHAIVFFIINSSKPMTELKQNLHQHAYIIDFHARFPISSTFGGRSVEFRLLLFVSRTSAVTQGERDGAEDCDVWIESQSKSCGYSHQRNK